MSFTRLDPSDFVISADSITAPAWSTNIPTLSNFYTASIGNFYIDVYNDIPSATNSAIQFSIAYGNVNGSGSSAFNNLIPYVTPTKVTYSQYRNLIYGGSKTLFNFGGSISTGSIDILALSIDRNRYKEYLFPGTFNLVLSSGSTSISLTDNSNDVSTITYLDCGRVFDIVSGSYGTAKNTPTLSVNGINKGYTAFGSYGLFLPDIGVIILNPSALAQTAVSGGISFNTSSADLSNEKSLYQFIKNGASFQLNSQETISSNYIFTRVKNADYNYTSNPSFISGSGNLVYSNFINNPQTYMTTIGYYNDNNELLAVAKLSSPLTKDFTKECLIRTKLDW